MGTVQDLDVLQISVSKDWAQGNAGDDRKWEVSALPKLTSCLSVQHKPSKESYPPLLHLCINILVMKYLG